MAKQTNLLNLVNTISNNESLGGLFVYNEMSCDIEITKKCDIDEWGHSDCLIDDDIIFLKYYLSKVANYEYSNTNIEEALMILSKRRAYHPIKNYLESLEWDGKPRISRWLIDICGCEDNSYIRDVSRKWLCGCIARIFNPGCQFDYMLILEGDQGIGKTTMLNILGNKWHIETDLCGKDNKKDLIDTMRLGWIIEIADMAGFSKHDIQSLRGFITRKRDFVRFPYERRVRDVARKCVLVGTHNPSGDNEYLMDDTGNRRYWPVECNYINLDKMINTRDQLFAEAVVKYREGETLFIHNEESIKLLNEVHQEREYENPFKEKIQDYAKNKSIVNFNEYTKRHMNIDIERLGSKAGGLKTQFGQQLKKMGFIKGKRGDKNYYNSKYYISPGVEIKTKKEITEEVGWDD